MCEYIGYFIIMDPFNAVANSTPDLSVLYLQSLAAVRQRALILSHPDCLKNFNVDESKLGSIADFIISLIARDYGGSISNIPPHSRWRHLDAGNVSRINPLVENWKSEITSNSTFDDLEPVRKVIDLFVVSVLLDAGSGDHWKFIPTSENGKVYTRSEGLAVASIDLFNSGALSSVNGLIQADGLGLKGLSVDAFSKYFQVSSSNPLVGTEGRVTLLNRLGSLLTGTLENSSAIPKYFLPPNHILDKNPSAPARIGYLVDYLLSQSKIINNVKSVSVTSIWEVLMLGLSLIWPSAPTKLNGKSLGDVWPSKALAAVVEKYGQTDPTIAGPLVPEARNLSAFHKLSQWIAYSLIEPLETFLSIKITDVDLLTGLPEYRNGGLFVDFGVLTLKPEVLKNAKKNPITKSPIFKPSDDVIVEWRSLTISLIDKLAEIVRKRLNAPDLPLAKILEAGTWKAGREIAAKLRSDTKGPPIEIESDGTVF